VNERRRHRGSAFAVLVVTLLVASQTAGCVAVVAFSHRLERITPTQAPSELPATPSTPTATGADLPPCPGEDLVIHAGRDGETGVVHVGVGITNNGTEACTLPGVPSQVELLASTKALPLRLEPALGDPAGRILVRPGVADDANLIFYWMNWCGQPPGPLRVSITFDPGSGQVIGDLEGPLLPRCDAPGQPSSIQIDSVISNGS
jgi:hypothetical protein